MVKEKCGVRYMIIYTDGSCLGNGKEHNTGGFGVVVLDNNENLLYTYSK